MQNLDGVLEGKEESAWNDFRFVAPNFLGNKRAENYTELVKNMLPLYQAMSCNMSLKIHLMHSHLDFFPENCGALSEKRYQGKWNPSMLADYCWTIINDVPQLKYKKTAKR